MSKISNIPVRIKGRSYALLFTKQRQIFNGRQVPYVIDDKAGVIRLDRRVRDIISDAVGHARDDDDAEATGGGGA